MLVERTDTKMEGEKRELFSDEYGMLHAELSINNDLRLLNRRFLIDSGCFFDIAIAREDFARLEDFGVLRQVTTIASGNRKGIAERKLGTVEFVKFLGKELRGVKVIERDEGQVIGMLLLQRLNLSICFANSEIWLRP